MSQAIVTTRSAIAAADRCMRLRWWQYEAPNGTNVRGWERRALAVPLVTGIYTHRGLAHLLLNPSNVGLDEAVRIAVDEYRAEIDARSLDILDVEMVRAEQEALIEAMIRGWARVRLPLFLAEYETLHVEREELATLADDVSLQARADAILKRKSDSRNFIWNFKTVSDAGERWYRQWEVDSQLLTETLAVEQRMGIKIAGVIIEGLIKGKRMPTKDADGNKIGEYQASPLIYGYKFDGNPPLESPAYDFQYTRKKGWHRFAVWSEIFPMAADRPDFCDSLDLHGVSFWVNWLPEEIVEQQFVSVPPIMADPRRIERKVIQIVSRERRIAEAADICVGSPHLIDNYFPQNEHSCNFPTKCPMFDMCWTGGVAEAPAESGLYIPRVPHHAAIEEG